MITADRQPALFDVSEIPQIPPEQIPPDRRYPVELVEAALGSACVAQLRQARPKPPVDGGMMRDRFLVNPGAIGYWLHAHFGLNIFTDEAAQVRIDPLAEVITVRRKKYRLPHWCYLNTGLEPGDTRPSWWPGIPRPEAPREPANDR